jgi:hypothetical protein
MPSTSKKQHNFMAAVAKNPAFAKKAGVPQAVGQEFTEADKGRKFAKGGTMKDMKDALAKHAAKPAGKAHAGLKSGGAVFRKSADGVASKGKTKAAQVKMASGGMYKKGGMCK